MSASLVPVHHLTASKRKLGKSCLWWARPSVVLDPRSMSPAASFGVAFHECVERDETQRDEGVETTPTAKKYGLSDSAEMDLYQLYWGVWRPWWKEKRGYRTWRTEVAFAYDTKTDTARELPSEGHRDYSKAGPSDLCGTVDLFVVDEYGATVIDVKTGYSQHDIESHLDQLEHGAVCIARVYNLDRVTVAVAHATLWGVQFHERVLDAFALDAAGLAMREQIESIPTAKPHKGEHCRWCPARASCPETLQAVGAAVKSAGVQNVTTLLEPPVDNASALALLDALPRLESWIAERRKALETYAESTPIDLGDGKVWKPVEKPGKDRFDLDVQGAVDKIREILGEHATVALEMSTSKAAIDRAVRRKLSQEHNDKRGAHKPIVQSVLESLRTLGALKRSAATRVFEVTEAGKEESKENDE